MDLNFLDTSSKVTPLLVRLYDTHKLYGLAKDKNPQARSELSDAVSELLELELSARESELIADVLIALMRQAEKDLRKALSERLAVLENAPLRLVLQLANDEIEIAQPVLQHSLVLGDMDLIYIIRSKTPEYWREIAKRKDMSESLMEALAETRDLDTAITLAENENITLSEHVLVILSDIAQGHETLAAPLLRRDEITSDLANQLYHYVGEELKRYITSNFGAGADEAVEIVDEVVSDLDLSVKLKEDGFMPSGVALNAADRFKEKGLLTIALMVSTLKRGQISSFIAQFSKFLDMSPEMVHDILMQESGQALAVVCKATGIMKPNFVSIYLMTNIMRQGRQAEKIGVKDMNKALRYFDRIEPDVARKIVKNSFQDALKS